MMVGKSKKKTTKIEQEDLGTLMICAIRYCHGRETYMPSLVQGICSTYLQEISDKDLQVMIDDCVFQANMNMYGDPVIDKPGWIRFHEKLEEEKRRRETR